MSETKIETTIEGVQIRARKSDGWIFWTSAWESIYDLVSASYVRMTFDRYLYGHCSFYLINY